MVYIVVKTLEIRIFSYKFFRIQLEPSKKIRYIHAFRIYNVIYNACIPGSLILHSF